MSLPARPPDPATEPGLSREAVAGTSGFRFSRTSRRLQLLVDDAPLGLAVMTYDGHILECNRTLADLLGRRIADLIGRRFRDFGHPDDDGRLDRAMLVREGRTRMEKRYVDAAGRTVWFRISTSLIEEDGEPRLIVMVEDITESVRTQDELRHRSTRDPLTGLWNRDSLREHLRSELAALAFDDHAVSLLYFDLDRFKVINDSLGHDAGDRLLIEVAARLSASAPEPIRLFRVGGDEFAAVVVDSGRGESRVCHYVRQALSTPIRLTEREVAVEVSIGIAVARQAPAPGRETAAAEALVRDADTALCAAKSRGRDQVVVFDDSMHSQALARLDDEQDLRRALTRDEFRFALQPIFRGDDGSIREHEALVRWQHPTRGLLPPATFLDLTAELGLAPALGRKLIHLGCATLAETRRLRPEARMALNISVDHLLVGTLEADVWAALTRFGLPPSALTLEVTEQTLVQTHNGTGRALEALRAAGCLIAIDDFGTGYSSLAYLRQLPVDVLKIDRAFVSGLGTPANDGALFRAIVALGHSLGLETVAEGIETEEELRAVREAGATFVQGFLLGRPALS